MTTGTLDDRSLAAMRVGMASIILWDLATRWGRLLEHYTDQGALPRRFVSMDWGFSIHMWSGSPAFQAGLFVLAALTATALLIGWKTRAATIVSWVLLVSLHDRNPHILFAVDDLLRCLLFWGIFLPWGRRWSLDARRTAPSATHAVNGPGVWAYLLQISFVYGFTLLLKSDPMWHTDLTAVYYPLVNDQMARPLARSVLAHPALIQPMTAAVVLIWAVVTPMVLSPWRTAACRALIASLVMAIHFSLNLFIRMDFYPALSSVAMLGLLPAGIWERRGRSDPRQDLHADGIRPRWEAALITVLLSYAFLTNCASLGIPVWIPRPLDAAGRLLHFRQNWGMFAPSSRRPDGRLVFAGELEDGRRVDLFRHGAPLSWYKPPNVAALYETQRMRRYFIRASADPRLFGEYLRFRCRRWNESAAPGGRLKTVDAFLFQETDFIGRPSQVERLHLRRLLCSEDQQAARAFQTPAIGGSVSNGPDSRDR